MNGNIFIIWVEKYVQTSFPWATFRAGSSWFFFMQEASTTIKSQAQAQALAAKEESHQSTLAGVNTSQEVGSDTENALPASITSASVNPVR